MSDHAPIKKGEKKPRRDKSCPSCQQQVSFDDKTNAIMPANLKFFRVDAKTTSYHYHMSKKPLTTIDCKAVESLLGLKFGTCYVLSDWMRLKAITTMHTEWTSISRNLKTPYKQVQESLATFFQKALAEFEHTYGELLHQEQIENTYYVKTRERKTPLMESPEHSSPDAAGRSVPGAFGSVPFPFPSMAQSTYVSHTTQQQQQPIVCRSPQTNVKRVCEQQQQQLCHVSRPTLRQEHPLHGIAAKKRRTINQQQQQQQPQVQQPQPHQPQQQQPEEEAPFTDADIAALLLSVQTEGGMQQEEQQQLAQHPLCLGEPHLQLTQSDQYMYEQDMSRFLNVTEVISSGECYVDHYGQQPHQQYVQQQQQQQQQPAQEPSPVIKTAPTVVSSSLVSVLS